MGRLIINMTDEQILNQRKRAKRNYELRKLRMTLEELQKRCERLKENYKLRKLREAKGKTRRCC